MKASQKFVNDLDTLAFYVSAAEASAATVGYSFATVVCAFSDGAACAPAIKEAFSFDVGITKTFGAVENTLGYLSAGITAANDYYSGNTGIDEEIGLYVGKDTIVAFRNSQAGRVPEAYVDFAVSASQSQYDKDRTSGKKAGGYVPVFSFEFIAQTLFKDWW